jgi:copper chaperone CopZ
VGELAGRFAASSMAIVSLNEFFYRSASIEPTHIINYARPHTPHSSDEAAAAGQHVALMVPICCTKCAEKVKEVLWEVEGVNAVMCDRYNHKVTVTGSGYIDPVRVLKKAKQVQSKSELWTLGS